MVSQDSAGNNRRVWTGSCNIALRASPALTLSTNALCAGRIVRASRRQVISLDRRISTGPPCGLAAVSLGLGLPLRLGLRIADGFCQHLAQFSLGLRGFPREGLLPLCHPHHVGMPEGELNPRGTACGSLMSASCPAPARQPGAATVPDRIDIAEDRGTGQRCKSNQRGRPW